MRGVTQAQLGCVACLVALARVSAAADPAAADSASAAKSHYAEAMKRYNLSEFAKALEEFKGAYLAKPDPAFLFNIAQCQRQLAQFEDAEKSYKAFLRESPGVAQAQREQVQRLIADMERAAKEAAAHRALPPMETQPPKPETPSQLGRIQITSEPSGAMVRLDSAESGETPYEARGVAPGNHTVSATRSGYQPKSAEVAVEPSGVVRLHLTLTPARAAPAAESTVKRPRYWIAGVVAGAVAVAALGIGLGVGLSGSHDASVPSTQLGSMPVRF